MHVLYVEDDEINVEVTRTAIRFARGKYPAHRGELELTHVGDLTSALDSLTRREFDVILLDLGLPDSRGLATLTAVVNAEADAPIVVMTGHDDSELGLKALQQGADDFLSKTAIDGDLLTRSLVYARERFELRRKLEQAVQREAAEREMSYLASDPWAGVARLRTQPLEEHDPQAFARFADEFERLMDRSLEQRLYKIDHNLSEQLVRLGEDLGRLMATPQDVVALSRVAAARKADGGPPQKRRAYAEEGRLLLLGLMARLATYYRTVATSHAALPPSTSREALS